MNAAIRRIEVLMAWQALEQSESGPGLLALYMNESTQQDLDIEIGRFWQWAEKFPQQSDDKQKRLSKTSRSHYMVLIRKYYQLIAQRTF